MITYPFSRVFGSSSWRCPYQTAGHWQPPAGNPTGDGWAEPAPGGRAGHSPAIRHGVPGRHPGSEGHPGQPAVPGFPWSGPLHGPGTGARTQGVFIYYLSAKYYYLQGNIHPVIHKSKGPPHKYRGLYISRICHLEKINARKLRSKAYFQKLLYLSLLPRIIATYCCRYCNYFVPLLNVAKL